MMAPRRDVREIRDAADRAAALTRELLEYSRQEVLVLTSSSIKQRARELGFDCCGVAPAAAFPELGFLREWLARGYAGDMRYLARTARRRADVREVVPSARSVIVTAMVYNTDRPYSTEITDRGEALIARYAWGDDYHDLVGRRLEALVAWMRERTSEPFEARTYVDTGPVQERIYAQHAGIGWIGKNTCVINPALGSWLFLSEIICSLPLESDAPALDQCGTCTLCLDACPTGAIVSPLVLDATRCLSYLTIELKGSIPPTQRPAIGSHVFGCDICQEVCPWNVTPARAGLAELRPRLAFDSPRLADLWRRPDEELEQLLEGSAMRRAKVTGLRRNLAVAVGNSGDPAAASVLDEHPAADPMVAEHVAWARNQLGR